MTNTLDSLFNLININDLVGFLKNYGAKHPEFQKELDAYIKKECIEPGNTKVFDLRQDVLGAVDESVREGRYGKWLSLQDLACQLDEVFENAENLMVMGNPEAALAAGVQTLAVLGSAFDEYQPDDSDGYTSDIYDHAIELIFAAAKHHALAKETVGQYVAEIEESDDIATLYKYGFDSKDRLLMQLSLITKTAEERIPLLDKIIQSANHEYDLHIFVEQKINDLRQLGRNNEADKTILYYINLPEIRKIAVDDAEARNDYQEALKLVEEGLKVARNESHYGTEHDWMKRRLELYHASNNKTGELVATAELFVKENFSLGYYQMLKSLVPPSEWKDYLFTLIDKSNIKQHHTDALSNVYIAEKEWERLYNLVVRGKQTHIRDLDKYAIYLRHDHSAEILKLYDTKLRWFAKQNTGRASYETLVRSMRVMQHLDGGENAVKILADYFRQTYKIRRAMMELMDEF